MHEQQRLRAYIACMMQDLTLSISNTCKILYSPDIPRQTKDAVGIELRTRPTMSHALSTTEYRAVAAHMTEADLGKAQQLHQHIGGVFLLP
jgi:hypothetical protein